MIYQVHSLDFISLFLLFLSSFSFFFLLSSFLFIFNRPRHTPHQEQSERRKQESATECIWPCELRIVPGCVFNKRDPIVIGVEVMAGSLRMGTPICVPTKDKVVLGVAGSIEHDHKKLDVAQRGQQVALKIEPLLNDAPKYFGRHFDESDTLVSRVNPLLPFSYVNMCTN